MADFIWIIIGIIYICYKLWEDKAGERYMKKLEEDEVKYNYNYDLQHKLEMYWKYGGQYSNEKWQEIFGRDLYGENGDFPSINYLYKLGRIEKYRAIEDVIIKGMEELGYNFSKEYSYIENEISYCEHKL